jgi:enamine deaminase RidA (YjgF/YER057c/UK114 family)
MEHPVQCGPGLPPDARSEIISAAPGFGLPLRPDQVQLPLDPPLGAAVPLGDLGVAEPEEPKHRDLAQLGVESVQQVFALEIEFGGPEGGRGLVERERGAVRACQGILADHPPAAPLHGRLPPGLHPGLVGGDDAHQVPQVEPVGDLEFAGLRPQAERGERTLGCVVGIGDPLAQAEQVFANLGHALAAADATFADVIKLTVFTTDIAYLPVIRQVRDRHVNLTNPPTSTAVQVVALAWPELLLEIEALAVV